MSDPARFLPIVYNPTVGEACLKFGHIFRRPRGMYLSLKHRGRIKQVLRNWPRTEVRVICASSGGRISGSAIWRQWHGHSHRQATVSWSRAGPTFSISRSRTPIPTRRRGISSPSSSRSSRRHFLALARKAKPSRNQSLRPCPVTTSDRSSSRVSNPTDRGVMHGRGGLPLVRGAGPLCGGRSVPARPLR